MMAKGEVGKGHSFFVAAHQLDAAGINTQVTLKHNVHKQQTESRINVFKHCPLSIIDCNYLSGWTDFYQMMVSSSGL